MLTLLIVKMLFLGNSRAHHLECVYFSFPPLAPSIDNLRFDHVEQTTEFEADETLINASFQLAKR